MPTPIRKVIFTKAGGPEVVQVVDDTLKDPAKGEIQVKVMYSGFGGSDINMREGNYPLQKGFPLSPGYCFVGRVLANGPDCSKYRIGDLVCTLSKYESEATYTLVKEKYAWPVPEGLDLELTCPLILDWTTAYGMVYRAGNVQAGDKVFIHGLSGAVGQAVFQLCKLRGAVIYGTASASKHEQLKTQGATEVFDYRSKSWIEAILALGGANIIFDPLGFESFDESFAALNRKRGLLIGYGAQSQNLAEHAQSRNVYIDQAKLYAKNLCWTNRATTFFYVDRDQKTFVPELQALFELARKGEIKVSIKKFLTLDEVPSVHEQWKKLEGVGSCVIRMEDVKEA